MNDCARPRTLFVVIGQGGGVPSPVLEAAIKEGIPALPVADGGNDNPLPFSRPPVERLRLAAGAGKGTAVLAAAALAKERGYEAILTLDAAEEPDPAHLRRLLDAAGGSWPAIVIGTRDRGTASPGGALTRFLVRLECGETVPDTESGFRLYPVDFLTSRHFVAPGRGFEVETLVRGAWAGLPLLAVNLYRTGLPAPATSRDDRTFRYSLDFVLLHTRLLARSLLPWPHRRMVPKAEGTHPLQLLSHPLRFFRLLCREHASAAELAAAAWVGIFIGALPIIPFGLVTIVYVNHKLHLNKLAGVAASNVCVFPFVPLLCVEVGHFFRFGRFWSEFNRQTLLHELHHRLWEWLLGALVVGPVIGLAGALVTYLVVRYLRSSLGKI